MNAALSLIVHVLIVWPAVICWRLLVLAVQLTAWAVLLIGFPLVGGVLLILTLIRRRP
jgi:hypothetical protein